MCVPLFGNGTSGSLKAVSDTEPGRHLLVAKSGPKYVIFLNPGENNNLTYHTA